MSRAVIVFIAVLVLIVAALIALASMDTEVAPTTVSKAMMNEAQAR